MTPEQFDNMEKRTRKVEEAIIKFQFIADKVLISLEDRMTEAEKDVENIKHSIYQTCDAKTKEVDDKIAEAVKTASRYGIGALSTLGGLFISALVYFNNENGAIYERINSVSREVTEDKTNISNVKSSIDVLGSKMDKMLEHISNENK